MVAVLAGVAVVSCSAGGAAWEARGSPSASSGTASPAQTMFSVGVHPPADNQNASAFEIKVLKELGVSYTRSQVSTIGQADQLMSGEYKAFQDAGIKVLLNIYNKDRNGPAATNRAGKDKPISAPPTDSVSYRTEVAKLLDTYRPALVTVENEENGHYYSGTPASTWTS